MNLILFSQKEVLQPLPISDARAQHILKVLKVEKGCSFDVGQINGPRGKATLRVTNPRTLEFEFDWEPTIPELYEIDLLISFCRPQTCRKMLQECTSLGVRSLTFFDTEKSEPNYKSSSLWTSGEAERLLIRGAEQAFCTQIPKLSRVESLGTAISDLSSSGSRIAMDNYESTEKLTPGRFTNLPLVIAIGGERGWSALERHLLRENKFILADLGSRVLRTETACIAAVSILRNQL